MILWSDDQDRAPRWLEAAIIAGCWLFCVLAIGGWLGGL